MEQLEHEQRLRREMTAPRPTTLDGLPTDVPTGVPIGVPIGGSSSRKKRKASSSGGNVADWRTGDWDAGKQAALDQFVDVECVGLSGKVVAKKKRQQYATVRRQPFTSRPRTHIHTRTHTHTHTRARAGAHAMLRAADLPW